MVAWDVGEMQNPDANQLPEVDSLPDGFVESTTEPLAPPTPTPEQEKPLNSYKDDGSSDLIHSNELSNDMGAKEFQANHGKQDQWAMKNFSCSTI